MLLKFESTDIHRSSIIDCATGDVVFRTVTPTRQTQTRKRSGSRSTLRSTFLRISEEKLPAEDSEELKTVVEDADGHIIAEITWEGYEGNTASCIRIGEEYLTGAADLFDAEFVKIYPEETLMPTRLEYVWRLTADSLTLLDDDNEEIGASYKDHTQAANGSLNLTPTSTKGSGSNFLLLNTRPDEVLEMLVCHLLLSGLRERLYLLTKAFYEQWDQQHQQQCGNPFARFRRGALRNLAQVRDSLRRGPSSPVSPLQ
ncbi:hypothetical protein WOLCODRAFT_135855 [Wolfiporia cocos MD-104 SS10]|uniref:Uncharacterized protein n=1 Tax=Wolfiporia cocos (strain MD-104) TaxID=742152 RepID=A0A2H3JGB0_WOLCO|nr:hypothetical protein WOLCODRAFT_135855 [Wolfiporia cocos MD-104 SS10]